jgi:hypothetical protein
MPYELLLAIWLFLCAGAGRLYSSLAKLGLCLGLCVLPMCCKIAEGKNYFDISENSSTFVVRTKSNINGANHTKNAETKIRGRHTGESPAVISMHRIDLVRSDLPSLFNSKSFFMRTKNDERTKSSEIGTYVPEIKNLHAGSRQSVINGLFNRPINQLVHDFVVEMDAKNTAYYFILENGHFDSFADYCKNSRKEVCHANS